MSGCHMEGDSTWRLLRVGRGEVGECHIEGDSTWKLLQLAVDRAAERAAGAWGKRFHAREVHKKCSTN